MFFVDPGPKLILLPDRLYVLLVFPVLRLLMMELVSNVLQTHLQLNLEQLTARVVVVELKQMARELAALSVFLDNMQQSILPAKFVLEILSLMSLELVNAFLVEEVMPQVQTNQFV